MTDAIKIEGAVTRKGEIKQFASGFQKMELAVETDGEYPQALKVEMHKDKASAAHKMIQIGDRVSLECNLRGRQVDGYDMPFISLVAFRFEVQGAASAPAPAPEPEPPAMSEPDVDEQGEMPF